MNHDVELCSHIRVLTENASQAGHAVATLGVLSGLYLFESGGLAMHKHRFRVSAALVVLTIAAGSALAQSTSPTPSPPSGPSSASDQVKDWTLKQWDAMKREWSKDRAKWDACNRQADDQKLTGKASWSFIFDCMKAS
jgi:hypothetical protein